MCSTSLCSVCFCSIVSDWNLIAFLRRDHRISRQTPASRVLTPQDCCFLIGLVHCHKGSTSMSCNSHCIALLPCIEPFRIWLYISIYHPSVLVQHWCNDAWQLWAAGRKAETPRPQPPTKSLEKKKNMTLLSWCCQRFPSLLVVPGVFSASLSALSWTICSK